MVGIDLAGVPARSTGFCRLAGHRTEVDVLRSDEEIVRAALDARPSLVLIDAPLSLPRGRATIEDRSGPHFRECDRELQRLGIRFFPLTLGPMRTLTVRGMRLAARLRSAGLWVEEGYPGGSQDRLGLPRKGDGVPRLQRALRRLGLRGDLATRPLTHDELDAVTIAYVAREFLRGDGVRIGDPSEGTMVLPRAVAPRVGARDRDRIRLRRTPGARSGARVRSPPVRPRGRSRRSARGTDRRRARRRPPPPPPRTSRT